MPLDSLTNTEHLHRRGLESVKYLPLFVTGAVASKPDEAPQIPSPSLFRFNEEAERERPDDGTAEKPPSSHESSGNNAAPETDRFSRLPTIAECATHLELLEVFYVIRQKILISTDIDHAMEIKPNRETKTGKKGDKKTLKDDTFWERRQAKWHRYLDFASARFLCWMEGLTFADTTVTGKDPRLLKHLPPLDILMVWHSYLLNPKLFQKNCGKRLIWRIRLPWEAIHAAIDPHDWTFKLSDEDAAAYSKRSGLPADLYQSFCDWDPTPSTAFSQQFRGKAKESVPISLTKFSFDNAVYVGRVPEPHDTDIKRTTAKYCKVFPKIDLAVAGKLKDAVIRQATFVDKMNAHLWIRSPAVEGTLRRAIERYQKFLGILKRSKTFTIVPTLDVDLAWHTNQCYSGLGYASTMKDHVGRFINHDDTIGKETLGDGFGETRKLWRVYYGKEYRICGCWDCEALTSAVEKASSVSDVEALVAKVAQDVEFYRICELRRRAKQPLPKGHDV